MTRKVCKDCGKRRVATAFSKDNRYGTLRASCKECVRAYGAKWRLKKGHVAGAIGAPRGERNGRSKLSDEDVRMIRDGWAMGFYKQSTLAVVFEVTPSYVSKIISGEYRKEED